MKNIFLWLLIITVIVGICPAIAAFPPSNIVLNLDGEGDYVQTTPIEDNLDITEQITIEAWVWPGSTYTRGNIIERGMDGGWCLSLWGTTVVLFKLHNRLGDFSYTSIPSNLWTHVAIT